MEGINMSADSPDIAEALRRQLGPCVEMLAAGIDASSEELWDERSAGPPVWAQIYHTLFWLDAWLRDWSRPLEYPPFHVKEALELRSVPAGSISRPAMREYLAKVSSDVDSHLASLTPESVQEPTVAFGKPWTPLDRILGQIRHVQHHVGYLNAVLRAGGCAPVAWAGFQE
jgi:hypothetical protein